MIRLGSPSVALFALTGGRPFQIYDHACLNAQDLINKIEKDIKDKHRLVTFAWDNSFEERCNGRLLSVSSPSYTVSTVDQKSNKI